MSTDAENEFFSDGIAEEILNVLAHNRDDHAAWMRGSDQDSHMGTPKLPSAMHRFTAEFGMGSGGSNALTPPGKLAG